ncbi:hypothetical protein ABZZ17_19575 [Streptomyces sp. NPDC006512]|uniref:hypothetical protein n=1 Tax=Streptomyces sp. NPDC006512 TaxID=3154307 RepID=UPI0033A7DFAE
MPQEQCEAAKADLERAQQLKIRLHREWDEARERLAELQAALPPDPKEIAAQEIAVENARKRFRAAEEKVTECRDRVDTFCGDHL